MIGIKKILLNIINFIYKFLKKIVVVLLIVVVVFSIASYFAKTNYKTESALMADAVASTTFKGVFIRDEQAITYDGSGAVCYGVPDGGCLGKGSVIADIYSTDAQILINQEIDKLNTELNILNKIQNPGTTEAAQPLHLSMLIDESYRKAVYDRETCNYDSLESERNDLLLHMSTYKMITDPTVDFSQRITDVKNRIAELKNSGSNPIQTIKSDRPAYFVSYCDGYEDKLNKENIGSLTVSDIENVTDTKEKSNTIIGKLIDGYTWELAGVVDNSKKNYKAGDNVKLKFESTANEFNATIIDIKPGDNPQKSIITLSCDEFNYDLVQHRCERTEIINGEVKGLKVPRKAIRFKEITEKVTDEKTGIESKVTTNYKGVYIIQGEQIAFRKLNVIFEGSDYVISEPRGIIDDDEYLSLYDDIIVEGVDSNGK